MVYVMQVLLVDDNKDLTRLVSEFLKVKGIDSVVTNDPKKGLDRIKEEKYDVVLLDNNMPGLYGTDIIQTLENEKILKDQNIIILSGDDFTTRQIEDLLKKDGIKNLLKKPTSLDDLFAEIVR